MANPVANATEVPAIPTQDPLPVLLGLTQRSLRCVDLVELGFIIANDTWHLAHYGQAIVFLPDRLGRPALTTISGLASCAENTPYTQWLGAVGDHLADAHPEPAMRSLQITDLPEPLREGWHEWWPASALLVPLVAPRDGHRLGFALFVRDREWQEADRQLLEPLVTTWSHVAASLVGPRRRIGHWWSALATGRGRRIALIAAAVVVLLPVRTSVLAPAEIIPLETEAIAAPMDGVVRQFHVPPNADVKAGALLFSLDDTTLRNRRAVADKSLAVARAEALAAQQKAFDNPQSRAELARLVAQVREREAELAYVDESLARIDYRAPRDGVFVYADPNDWIGKPVVTGERIGQIAQPEPLGLLVWLPVGDAINLAPGAQMRMYTQVAPLSSMAAELIQTSYQATTSPEGVVAYRIRGRLSDTDDARIGLRGTAKVYGQWRPLVYWVLRRPLGALRQILGL